MTDEKLIPVTDVTEHEQYLAAHQKAVEAAQLQLASEEMFIMVSIPKDGVRVTAIAGQQQLEQALYALLTTYGADLLGPAADNLPASLADVLKATAGLNSMHKLVQAMVAPRTPAGDAASKTEH